jgi:hypothetical protein
LSGSASSNYSLTGGVVSVSINKANAVVTANSNTVTYNGLTQTVTGFSATGLVNGETSTVLTNVTTSGGSGKNAGTYALTASGSDQNYNLSFVNGALTINKANAVVTANSNTVIYNGLTQTVTGFSTTGLVNGETSTVLTNVTTSGGSGKNIGTYTLTASGSDPNYNLSFVDGMLTVNKASLTVSGANNTLTYNGSVISNSGASYSGQQGSDSFIISGYASGTRAGTYTDSLSVSGSALANYDVTYNNGSLVIGKANLTITGANNTLTYTGSAQTNGAATISGQQGNDSFAVTGYANGFHAGSYTDHLVVTGDGLDNYSIQTINGVLTITPASLLITANDFTKSYDGIPFKGGNGISIQGLLGSDTLNDLGGVLTYTGSSQGALKADSYSIIPSGLASTNYQIIWKEGLLQINPVAIDTIKQIDAVFLNLGASIASVMSPVQFSVRPLTTNESFRAKESERNSSENSSSSGGVGSFMRYGLGSIQLIDLSAFYATD